MNQCLSMWHENVHGMHQNLSWISLNANKLVLLLVLILHQFKQSYIFLTHLVYQIYSTRLRLVRVFLIKNGRSCCVYYIYVIILYSTIFLLCSSLDNKFRLNSSSQYFLGSELVDWLLEVGLVADRITAAHYGNSLLRGRVIRHSEKRYYFRDSDLTYEFCPGWDSEAN